MHAHQPPSCDAPSPSARGLPERVAAAARMPKREAARALSRLCHAPACCYEADKALRAIPGAPFGSVEEARRFLRATSLRAFGQGAARLPRRALELLIDQLGDPRHWPAGACELGGRDLRVVALGPWKRAERFLMARFLVFNGMSPELAWEYAVQIRALRDESARRHFASLLELCEPSFSAQTLKMRWSRGMRPLLPDTPRAMEFRARYSGYYDLRAARYVQAPRGRLLGALMA